MLCEPLMYSIPAKAFACLRLSPCWQKQASLLIAEKQFPKLFFLRSVHRGRKLTSSTGTIQAHCLFIFLFKILCASCDGQWGVVYLYNEHISCRGRECWRRRKKQPAFQGGLQVVGGRSYRPSMSLAMPIVAITSLAATVPWRMVPSVLFAI